MRKTYVAHGAEASDTLMQALIADGGAWAHAVLQQCFSVPERERNGLLTGEIEWLIPNGKTLATNQPECQSPPKQDDSDTSSQST